MKGDTSSSMLLTCLIKCSQHPGGDDGPEANLRKQRERSEQEETVDQQLDGMRIRKLRDTHANAAQRVYYKRFIYSNAWYLDEVTIRKAREAVQTSDSSVG